MATRNPIPFQPDALLSVIERLESAAVELRAVQAGMIDRKISQLEIVNAKEMRKGLEKVDAFTRAAVQAYHDYRLDNGGESKP